MPSPDVILVGASVRSLAESAMRDSLQPLCVDFFGDADLREQLLACPEFPVPNPLVIDSYADVPSRLADVDRAVPVILIGGAETNLELRQQLAVQRPVANLSAAQIRALRDPATVFSALQQAGCFVPPWIDAEALNRGEVLDGDWLVKDRLSSGGQLVRDWTPGDAIRPTQFLQQRLHGPCFSASFFSAACGLNSASVTLEGVALQLSGCRELNCSDFRYCGNVGGIAVSDRLSSLVMSAANAVANRWPWQGFLGIDFVLTEGKPFVIEVNPRLTASHELHERTNPGGRGHVVRQLDAFNAVSTIPSFSTAEQGFPTARFVVYATENVRISPDQSTKMLAVSRHSRQTEACWLSDIPVAESLVPQGTPLCSVYLSLPKVFDRTALQSILEFVPTDTSKLAKEFLAELQGQIEVVKNV